MAVKRAADSSDFNVARPLAHSKAKNREIYASKPVRGLYLSDLFGACRRVRSVGVLERRFQRAFCISATAYRGKIEKTEKIVR